MSLSEINVTAAMRRARYTWIMSFDDIRMRSRCHWISDAYIMQLLRSGEVAHDQVRGMLELVK